jgi:CDP-diacylglycerol--glycerol-3-phosphate 3-phosphatidyltransferase
MRSKERLPSPSFPPAARDGRVGTVVISVYQLKPRFQNLLRPYVVRLAERGVTANQVTVAAAGGSIGIGILVLWLAWLHILFVLIALWLLLRMALNAVDGMLAREFGQQSRLGAYLNELGDIVSDAALFAPFAVVAPFGPLWVGIVIFLAIASEFAGALGPTVGAPRQYQGPMGKSDRALVFGILAVWVAVADRPDWLFWLMPILSLLLLWTIAARIAGGIRNAAPPP